MILTLQNDILIKQSIAFVQLFHFAAGYLLLMILTYPRILPYQYQTSHTTMAYLQHTRPSPSLAEIDTLWSRLTFGTAQQGRQTSERIMASGFRLSDEHREHAAHATNEVQFQLHQRLQDMAMWVEEFARKSEDITGTVNRVKGYLTRVKNAMVAVKPILRVDYDILKMREGRIGVDQVEDGPHKAILAEVNLLMGEEQRLQTLHIQVDECLRLLRKTGYTLGKELLDRRQAVAIDYAALNLNPHSSQVVNRSEVMIAFKGETTRDSRNPHSRHQDNEQDWEKLSWKQVNAAEKLLKEAESLTIRVESILQSSCERIQRRICDTNGAFEARLVALRRVKGNLEEEHEQISINIRNMEDTLDKMKKSIIEKEAFVALAQTRIALRQQRPNFELVKDQVDKGLELELLSLQDSIALLHGQLVHTQKGLRALCSNQIRLEEEINVKVQTIAIDETNVLPLRKSISVQLY